METIRFRWKHILSLLALFLLLSGCGKGCGKGDGDAPVGMESESGKISPYQLIPKEFTVVGGIDLKRVFESPVGEEINKQIPEDAKNVAKKMEKGIFAIDTLAKGPGGAEALIILSSSGDKASLLDEIKNAKKEGAADIKEEEYQGVKMLINESGKSEAVALLDGYIVMGSTQLVKKAVDASKLEGDNAKASSIQSNEEIMKYVNATDKNKMIWMAGLAPKQEGGSAMGMADKLKAFQLELDYPKDLEIALDLIALTEEDAKQLNNQAEAFKTLASAQGGAGQNQDMVKVLEALSFEQNGERFKVSLALSNELIENLKKKPMLPMMGAPGAVPPGAMPPPEAMTPPAAPEANTPQ